MSQTSPQTSILSVRVNPSEKAMLEAAAEQARTTISDFMRREALKSAEMTMLARSIVTIPASDWEAFESWIARPAEVIPALFDLSQREPTWES